MPRLGLGMPIISGASNAPVTVIDDVLWEDFGGSGGEIALNYQETRTNSVLHSQDVTDAEAWTKTNTAIDSTLYEAPDNSTTANAIKSNSTGEKAYNISQGSLSVTAGKTYTLSVHVKKENLAFARVYFSDGASKTADFNLNTAAVTNTSNTIRTQVDSMDDNWYRCSITFIATSTTSSGSAQVFALSAAGDNTPNVAVSGVVLIYVWGFQLEESIEATSYIVTTTEARTATTTLNDTSDVWDFDGADLMPEADPDSEGVWEEGNNLVLNGDYEELGSEQANYSNNNISFNNASDSTTISLGSNSYRSEAFGNSNDARPRVNINGSGIVTGKTYEVTYTPTSFTGSTVFDFFQNSTRIISDQDASIAKTFYFVASDGYDGFDFDGSQTFRSDYTLSIKQVDPNDRWSLGTGWSIEDGKLKATSTDAEATQASIITPGNSYEVTFTIDSIASGSVRVKAGTTAGSTRTSAGTYTQVLDVLYGSSLAFDMVSSGTCVIDNVTVREYAIQPKDI